MFIKSRFDQSEWQSSWSLSETPTSRDWEQLRRWFTHWWFSDNCSSNLESCLSGTETSFSCTVVDRAKSSIDLRWMPPSVADLVPAKVGPCAAFSNRAISSSKISKAYYISFHNYPSKWHVAILYPWIPMAHICVDVFFDWQIKDDRRILKRLNWIPTEKD